MGRSTRWIGAAALASGALACNALFGDSAQCANDGECTHFGPSYVCGAGGTCVGGASEGPNKGAPAASSAAPTGTDAGTPPAASLASITISPSSASVAAGRTQQFTASAKDGAGNPVSPSPQFAWSVSGGGSIDANGLFTAGSTSAVPIVTARVGPINATASVSVTVATLTMGESTILNVDDSGNANLLLAQEATLAKPATIRSLSFYIATANGKLRLGIYDATGPGNGPGAKKAETAEVAAVAGWNATSVITPVLLPAGTYWLAYFPDDDNLHFNRAGDDTGKIAYYSLPYGPMPATFSTTPTALADHWSFYATLTP